MEDEKTNDSKNFTRWQKKRKIKKLSEFKLSKEEKFLIKANDNEIKELVIQDINKGIEKNTEEIEKINKNLLTDKDNSKLKKHKKYLIQKLKKLKKCLNDEGGIAARIKLYKQKKHKLSSKKNKIEKTLGDLKSSLKRCLKCKKRGHLAENCPLNDDEKGEEDQDMQSEKICYNCGSKDHSLYNCDKPIDYSNLPFALCFKCKKRGHISANCPENENGIYIRGGSCYICKGKDHLAKNCPQKQSKEEAFKSNKNK